MSDSQRDAAFILQGLLRAAANGRGFDGGQQSAIAGLIETFGGVRDGWEDAAAQEWAEEIWRAMRA